MMDLVKDLIVPDLLVSSCDIEEILFTPGETRTQLIEWLLLQAQTFLELPIFPDQCEGLSKLEQLETACLKLRLCSQKGVLPFLQCSNVSRNLDEVIWEQLFIFCHMYQQKLKGDSTIYRKDSKELLDQLLCMESFNKLRKVEVNFDGLPSQGTNKRFERSDLVSCEKSCGDILRVVKERESALRMELMKLRSKVDPSDRLDTSVDAIQQDLQSHFQQTAQKIERLSTAVQKFHDQYGALSASLKPSKHSRTFSKLGPAAMDLCKAQQRFKQQLELNKRLGDTLRRLQEETN